MASQQKAGAWIFTLLAVTFAGLEIYGVTDHSHNPDWPHHALFHAVTGLFDELTLAIFALVLTWRYLPAGDRMAWWGMALIGLSLFGGLLVGDVFSHHGLSGGGESLGHPELFTVLAWAAVALWLVGLFLTRVRD
jgi:hypothetical protein